MPRRTAAGNQTMHQCVVCGAMLRSKARLRRHQLRTHRVPTVARANMPRRSRRRVTRSSRPRQDPYTGQIMQSDQNLPIPAMTKSRRSAPGARGVISRSVDTAIDKILTPAGCDFVHRSCHPNDDSRAGGVFIPDDTTADRAIIESRPYAVIQYPGTSDKDINWDVMVCVLSLSDIPFVYRWKDSNQSDWSRWYRPESDNYIQPGSIDSAYFEKVDNKQVPEQVSFNRTPTLLTDTTQFRQSFKGITIVMNAATLYDQGYVTSGQWGNKAKTIDLVPTDCFSAQGDEFNRMECLVFDDVPRTMSDIIAACPEYGQWEAKKGVYMPMRYDDPVHEFNGGVTNSLTGQNNTSQFKAGAPVVIASRDGNNGDFANDAFFKWGLFDEPSSGGNGCDGPIKIPTTAGDVNQTFGCILFSGIDRRSQLIVKCRLGLDLVPSPRSPFSAMSKKGPVKDQLALDMATSIQAKLPVVYEHKYNSLSMIVPWIAKAAMGVLPTIAPWIGSKVTQGIDWLGQKIFGGGVPNA